MKYDTIIVGAGIAGASVALQLGKHQRVLLIEADKPAAGASGVAGGLFSPMIALRGRPVWQIDAAIDAFHEQLEMASAAHLFDNRGVLRPAKDAQQVEFFKQSVQMCPAHAEWWSADEAQARYPRVYAPHGALFAKTGGAFSTSLFSELMVAAAVQHGVTYLEQKVVFGWMQTQGRAAVDVRDVTGAQREAPFSFERYFADRIVFAFGRAFFDNHSIFDNHSMHNLDLHAVKGQTIRIKRPDTLPIDALPPTSGQAYIIPEGDMLAIGSSFEHTFKDDAASSSVSKLLLKNAATLVPLLAKSQIIEEHVGIRVTVPKIRLPMVGPLDENAQFWIFTGFGSKGLLLAPFLASRLLNYFQQPALIPPEIRVRVKTL